MCDKGAKMLMFEKRRRFCRAGKKVVGPGGCLAWFLLICSRDFATKTLRHEEAKEDI